jgi:4-amino-4-deoxy-L-arabinose transferase-like glycosyltransferase
MSQTRFTCFISIETLFFLILLAMQFAFLDASPIYILDESKFAEADREMLVSGDYWIPTFNGSLFVDKPPLQYFFMMLGFKIFGINPLGALFFLLFSLC